MSYRYLDIAMADVAFEAWGASVEELFVESAEATLSLMVADPQELRGENRSIELSSESIEMLLFDLLQEMVYYKDAEQLLLRITSVSIQPSADGFKLSAQADGQSLNEYRHGLGSDIKAVTLHRFSVEQLPQGWKSTVILDV
jgi:SHS2 domain-containing protein